MSFSTFLEVGKLFTGPQLAVLANASLTGEPLHIAGAYLRYCNVDRQREYALLTFNVLVRIDGVLSPSFVMVQVTAKGYEHGL